MAFDRTFRYIGLFFYLALVLLFGFASVGASLEFPIQGCSEASLRMGSPTMEVNINGTRMQFRTPQYLGEAIDERSMFQFQITSIQETKRTGGNCTMAQGIPIFDLPLRECQCTYQAINSAERGINTTGWTIKFFGCAEPQPELTMLVNMTISNVTTTEMHGPTMFGSLLDSFHYTSYAGGFKIGVEFEGWRWNTSELAMTPVANNTFLSLMLHIGWETPRPMIVSDFKTIETYKLETRFGDAVLDFNFDRGYILDDIPIITSIPRPEQNYSLPDGTPEMLVLDSQFVFCEPVFERDTPLRRWNKYFYDPSLLVVIGSAPIEDKKSSPKAKSWKAVYIAVPIVVIILILIVIALFVFVKPVRNAILPYNRRRENERKSHVPNSSSPSSSAWTASKPPTLAD